MGMVFFRKKELLRMPPYRQDALLTAVFSKVSWSCCPMSCLKLLATVEYSRKCQDCQFKGFQAKTRKSGTAPHWTSLPFCRSGRPSAWVSRNSATAQCLNCAPRKRNLLEHCATILSTNVGKAGVGVQRGSEHMNIQKSFANSIGALQVEEVPAKPEAAKTIQSMC